MCYMLHLDTTRNIYIPTYIIYVQCWQWSILLFWSIVYSMIYLTSLITNLFHCIFYSSGPYILAMLLFIILIVMPYPIVYYDIVTHTLQ